jgi:hypothetical protein
MKPIHKQIANRFLIAIVLAIFGAALTGGGTANWMQGVGAGAGQWSVLVGVMSLLLAVAKFRRATADLRTASILIIDPMGDREMLNRIAGHLGKEEKFQYFDPFKDCDQSKGSCDGRQG